MENLLEMRHVTKRFPGVLALYDVNLELKNGEILGICGENGAGKSTLMKILSGSYVHSEYDGDIRLRGEDMLFTSVHDAQNQGIEMVYQEMNMMLDASVAENLFVGNLPCTKGWVDYRKLYTDSRALMERVGLEINPKEIVRKLNSGQMQLLSLMRAIAKEPAILVLDEPTSALSEHDVKKMMEILFELKAKGTSCLYISHKLDEIYQICDRVLVLRDGETINTHLSKEVKNDTLIEEMVGRKLDNLYPKESHDTEEEVLRVEKLSVPHPSVKGENIIEDISFSLHKGEILGIGGLVGAGRSEMLGAIFGQYKKGVNKRVFLYGKEVRINSPRDAISLGIGFLTEERKRNGIIWMLSIKENITIASLPKLPGKWFINRKHEKRVVQEQMESLRIKAPSMKTKIVQLSGGNQQKVLLGKWLLSSPKILFVDEPTKGVDVGTKADFYQIMSELTKAGISIIMVSSDMPELISMSDRILVIAGGEIKAELSKKNDGINEINVMRAAIAK